MYRLHGHAYNEDHLYKIITNNIVRVLAQRINVAMALFLTPHEYTCLQLLTLSYNTVHLEQQQQSPVNTGRETGRVKERCTQ